MPTLEETFGSLAGNIKGFFQPDAPSTKTQTSTPATAVKLSPLLTDTASKLGNFFAQKGATTIKPAPEVQAVKGTDLSKFAGQTISAGEPSLSQKFVKALPDSWERPAELIIEQIHDGLFGNTKDKAFVRELQKQGYKVSLPVLLTAEGFLPFMGRTQTEQVTHLADQLESTGVDPERASAIAFYDVFSRGNPSPTDNKGRMVKAQATAQLDNLKLTDAEEWEVTKARWGQTLGMGSDALNVLPVGSIIGKARLGTVATLLKETENTADGIAEANRLLRTAGVAAEIAEKYAPKLAATTDLTAIQKHLAEIADVMRSLKPTVTAGNKATQAIEEAAPVTTRKVGEVAEAGATASKTGATAEVERGFVTSVKEAFPDVSARVAGTYIPRSTDELATRARNLIRDDIVKAERIATTGTDDSAVAVASELIKHYADEAAIATNTAVKTALEEKLADIANTAARNLTEHGRAVQAASIIGRMTPEGTLRFAAREIQKYNEAVEKSLNPLAAKIPELTAEQAGNIVKRAREVAKIEDPMEKAMKVKELQDTLSDLVPSPLWKKIQTVWKAGLLTGIKTSGLNILSNATHFTSEVVKDAPAAVVDTVAALFTGKRTKTFTLKGSGGGVAEGFNKGWKYLKTGFDERDIGSKLDYKRVRFGTSVFARGIQKYEETIFHIIGAEDQPFYYGMKARSMFDQALAQGKNLGLKGDDLAEFANNLVRNPTDDMIKNAAVDAETAVFSNKTGLGEAGRLIQKIPVVGEFIVPFSRTPAAVAMQVINYSPVGAGAEAFRAVLQGIRKGTFDQRRFSQAMGRGITGTGILYLGTELYDAGIVSLDFPEDERERELWAAEGRKPNTIKIGDKWRSAQVLGPIGNLMIVGAHFKKGLEDTGSAADAMVKAMTGGAKSFTEQTFLHGLRAFTDAFNEPDRFAEAYFGNLLGSFVPTLVSDIGRAKDQGERRARTVLERVESRIPFLRESLEPQIDVLGRDRAIGGNFFEIMADPTRPTKDVSTPVTDELRRLQDAGFKASPTLLGDKDGYSSLTPAQNTELLREAGRMTEQKLAAMFQHPKYEKMDDETKTKNINKIVEQAKVLARAATIASLTADLSGQELKDALSEFKKSGLLTGDVLNKWKEIR